MTILVADRDAARLNNTEAVLRRIFPEENILTYTDPLLAAQYSSGNTVEIVVAVWSMRRMSGLQMASFVRKFNPLAQIYLIDCPEGRVGGTTREGDADYLLGEPLTEEALRAAIAFVAQKRGGSGAASDKKTQG